jgi:hypothetical protein
MIATDRARVCELMLRGYRNKSEMARIINQGRSEEFHISPQQITKDIKFMEEELIERGVEDLALAREQSKEELYYLLRLYYEGFERSRINKITLESARQIDTPEEYDQVMDNEEFEQEELLEEGLHPFNRNAKVKEEFRGEGNPAFLNGAKSVLDSIHKMKHVDGTTKVSLTDPTGTEEHLGIAEYMKQRIAELSTREAPTDTDQYLLESAPEQRGEYVDAEVIREEEKEEDE